ncbi:flagellar basal body-associated FliL family protein [Vibrio sp. AK197]|uniref:Flagellar protein FliL n=1 Tax=Vibrio olivae TaxID=1243002 RepID=A0ABV5HLS5_9VIBR
MTKQQLIAMFAAMIITSLLVSAGTIFGGAWYLKNSASSDGADGGSLMPSFFSSSSQPSKDPAFLPLDKVVLSVKGKKQNHFVMIELAIETRYPERIENLDNYTPLIRNALLRLFNNKTYESLNREGAVKELENEVKQTVLLAFEKTDIVREIDDVLLTKYVVQ